MRRMTKGVYHITSETVLSCFVVVSHVPFAARPPTHNPEKASKKEAVFTILDSDSDHHLNQGELFIVGKELFGFDGSDNEWQETYEALRNDFGFPEEGMDLSTFDKVLSASEESFPTGDHLEDDLVKASHEYAVHLKDHAKECSTL